MEATIDMNFQSDLMAIFEENLFWSARGRDKLRNKSSWIPLHGQNELKQAVREKRPHLTTRNTEEAELAMDKLRPWEREREAVALLLPLQKEGPSHWDGTASTAFFLDLPLWPWRGKERTCVWLLIKNMGAMDNVIAGGISERRQ